MEMATYVADYYGFPGSLSVPVNSTLSREGEATRMRNIRPRGDEHVLRMSAKESKKRKLEGI